MLHFQGFWYYACWFTDTYSMNVKKKKALVNKFVLLLLKLVKIAVLTADQKKQSTQLQSLNFRQFYK